MLLIIIDHMSVQGSAQDFFFFFLRVQPLMVSLHHLFLPPAASGAQRALPLFGAPPWSPVID